MRQPGQWLGRWILLGLALLLCPMARADDLDDMQAQLTQMQKQMTQLQEKIKQKQDTTRIEAIELQIQEILADAQTRPTGPKWLENLTFGGDMRLRYQGQNLRNSDAGNNRNRARYRLRFGFTKTWLDKRMEVGFRLATSLGSANSSNVSFGGEYEKKDIGIDLMYAKYKPNWAKGLVVTAGKMKNPLRSRTSMSWDSDINPEGFHIGYTLGMFGDFKPYAAAGYWIYDEGSKPNFDVTYWTFEGGFDWKLADDVNWFVGGTWYNSPMNWSNTGSISGTTFNALELTTKLKWKMDFMPTPLRKWAFTGSWFHNCNSGDTLASGNQNAYSVKLAMGQNKKRGDFSVGYEYRYVELNSIPNTGDGWGDSDFGVGTIGFSNTKGHILSAKYNLDDFLTLGGKLYATEAIDGDDKGRCLLQVDLLWKF